jgi:hypothetical protein
VSPSSRSCYLPKGAVDCKDGVDNAVPFDQGDAFEISADDMHMEMGLVLEPAVRLVGDLYRGRCEPQRQLLLDVSLPRPAESHHEASKSAAVELLKETPSSEHATRKSNEN